VSALLEILAALVILGLAVGTALEPSSSSYANLSSSLWPVLGPHFVVVAVIATLLAAVARLWGPPTLGKLAILLSGASLLGATYIVIRFMAATASAGGTVNPMTGLILSKMDVPPPDQTVSVSTVDGQNLDAAVYLPTSPPTNATVLVYIHGGGFLTGTTTETAADLRWFADRGWLVFSIDYRLFKPGRPTWDKAPVDVACGLAWVYANAARFGGNPNSIVLLGDSAGGNLAINLGFAAALGMVPSDCGPVPTPEAIVVQYPAVDPIAIFERGFPVPGFEPKMLMTGYIGGAPQDFPDRVRAISSETYISDKAPPTLVIEPEKDGLVVSESVYAFVERAKAGGVDIELVRLPFANHIYNQIAANSIGNQARLTITEHYLKALGLTP